MTIPEETTPAEVHCCDCGKAIPRIPVWLVAAKTVKFQCEECRQKNPRLPTPDIGPVRHHEEEDEVAPQPLDGVDDDDAEPDYDIAEEAGDSE